VQTTWFTCSTDGKDTLKPQGPFPLEAEGRKDGMKRSSLRADGYMKSGLRGQRAYELLEVGDPHSTCPGY
jgi:hypothetical protein